MKVLITGGSGRLGAMVISALAAEGYDVVVLARHAFSPSSSTPVHIIDTSDTIAIDSVFKLEKPEAVIHMAGMTGGECEKNKDAAYEINVGLTQNVALAAKKYGVSKFIFTSTAAVYSQRSFSMTSENVNVEPHSVYGKTKLEAEREIERISKNSDTKCVSLRIFNVYGPGFNQSLVNRLSDSTGDEPVSLVGFDSFYRDYVHAQDVVGAILCCLYAKSLKAYDVYNVASGIATSNKTLLEMFASVGKNVFYTISGDEVSYSWADISHAKQQLGYVPQYLRVILK